jgi:hypothetical protein
LDQQIELFEGRSQCFCVHESLNKPATHTVEMGKKEVKDFFLQTIFLHGLYAKLERRVLFSGGQETKKNIDYTVKK